MKTQTPFDPSGELIVVNATIWGPRGSIAARLAIDTGAAATVVIPDLLDELGYSPRDGMVRTSVHTAIGEEHGYLRKLTQFDALAGRDRQDHCPHLDRVGHQLRRDRLLRRVCLDACGALSGSQARSGRADARTSQGEARRQSSADR